MSSSSNASVAILQAVRSAYLHSRSSQARYFSVNHSYHAAKARVRQAPSLRRTKSNPGTTSASRQPSNGPSAYSLSESLPPVVLLESAYKSGALSLSPSEALELYRKFYEASVENNYAWGKKFCINNTISPATLCMLGEILNKCSQTPQKNLASRMMSTASELGHAEATAKLLWPAYRSGSLKDRRYEEPLKRLHELAFKDEDPNAMVLLGVILKDTPGKEAEAFKLFQKMATSVPSPASSHAAIGSEALFYQGQLLEESGDFENAEISFRKAAIEFDHPGAYYRLAKLQEIMGPIQEVYLLKAASSGVTDACFDLGELHLAKAKVDKDSAEKQAMAKEWFHVGAMGGHGPSMLSMATLQRKDGNPLDGWRWLEKAEAVPAVAVRAKKMKAQWSA